MNEIKTHRRRNASALRASGSFSFLTIVTLGLLISMGALHTDPIAASLPGMAQEFGCGSNGTANVVSAFLLGLMLGHLLVGPLSDVIGRKRSILYGLIILSVGAVICALSPSLPVLIAGRVIQGVGGAAATCSARAIGSDAGDSIRSARVLSFMQIISSATPIVMPLIGNGVAERLGWRAVFWMMLIVDLLLLTLTFTLVPAHAVPKKENIWGLLARDVLLALKKPTFIFFTLAFGFGISTFYCYTSASSFALQNELGVSAAAYSRLLSLMGVVMVCTAFLASRLPKRFGLVRSFVGAITVQLISALAMAAAFSLGRATVIGTVLCYALVAGSSSISIPLGLSLAVGEAGAIKGTASALCGFMQFLCSFAITSFLSTVKDGGSIGAVAGFTMAATTVIALTCTAVAVRFSRRGEAD